MHFFLSLVATLYKSTDHQCIVNSFINIVFVEFVCNILDNFKQLFDFKKSLQKLCSRFLYKIRKHIENF